MAVAVSVGIGGGEGLRRVLRDALARTSNPRGLLMEVGRRGANDVRAHLRKRNLKGNKLGGRRTNYWRRVADSVQAPEMKGSDAVVVSITDGTFAQKVFGGRIVPKNARALTVPVDARAHGRTVRVFEQETGIKLFKLRKRGGGLSNLLAGEDNAGIRVFYKLLGAVNQDKDAAALPPDHEFEAALGEQAELHLRRQIRN
jgi:hypothetical protein